MFFIFFNFKEVFTCRFMNIDVISVGPLLNFWWEWGQKINLYRVNSVEAPN
jgi:hypothetical protein